MSNPLSLESDHWKVLRTSEGGGESVPSLLRQLDQVPNAEQPPWPALLQLLSPSPVRSAAFAAVPHVVQALALAPERAHEIYFRFVVGVELARRREQAYLGPELREAYLVALARLPSLVAASAPRPWSARELQSKLAAITVAQDQGELAEAILEMDQETAGSYLCWLSAFLPEEKDGEGMTTDPGGEPDPATIDRPPVLQWILPEDEDASADTLLPRLAAIAKAKGQGEIAEGIDHLDGHAMEFLKWHRETERRPLVSAG